MLYYCFYGYCYLWFIENIWSVDTVWVYDQEVFLSDNYSLPLVFGYEANQIDILKQCSIYIPFTISWDTWYILPKLVGNAIRVLK